MRVKQATLCLEAIPCLKAKASAQAIPALFPRAMAPSRAKMGPVRVVHRSGWACRVQASKPVRFALRPEAKVRARVSCAESSQVANARRAWARESKELAST